MDSIASAAFEGGTVTRMGRIKQAKPQLVAALRAIDAAFDPPLPGKQGVEKRTLARIAAYEAWLVENGLKPPRSGLTVSLETVMRFIGCADVEVTPAIRRSVASLGAMLKRNEDIRHHPERPTDRTLDQYAEVVLERGHGLPIRADNGELCLASSLLEAGIERAELDAVVIRRFQALDAQARKPGRIVQTDEPPLIVFGRTLPNPAARALVEAHLASAGGKLPADPLDPASVGIPDLAWACGVSVCDIVNSPATLALVKAAVEVCVLVPHPVVAQRRMTFLDLKRHGRAARRDECANRSDPATAARATVASLNVLMSELGFTDHDEVPTGFSSDLRRAALVLGGGARYNSKDLERWIDYASRLRVELPLPEVFATAVRVLMTEAGVSMADVRRDVGDTAVFWIKGNTLPSSRSTAQFDALARELRYPAAALRSLLPDDLDAGGPEEFSEDPVRDTNGSELDIPQAHGSGRTGRRQGTEWAAMLVEATRDEYKVKPHDWTPEMYEAVMSLVPLGERSRPVMRVPGQRTTAEQFERLNTRAWRNPTTRHMLNLFGFYIGFLTRPAGEGPSPSIDELAPPEAHGADGRPVPQPLRFVAEPGLGIPLELLTPGVLAQSDLMMMYGWWRLRRTGGTASPIMIDTVRYVMALLQPGRGVVHEDPGQLEQLERFVVWWNANAPVTTASGTLFDIDAFRSDWKGAVAAEYEQLRLDKRQFQLNRTRPLRDPFAPIANFIADDLPMRAYMAGIRNLLDHRPMVARVRHAHVRDCIMALIEVQTLLRAGNLLLTISGPEPTLRREVTEDGRVTWRVRIPGDEFKNYWSPHFAQGRPFDFLLEDEDGLYGLLEYYISKSRPYLLAGRTSDALLITSVGNDFDASTVTRTYYGITRRHFADRPGGGVAGAMPHGIHAVRHIAATHIVKTTGDIYMAAWALQDHPGTIERNYARFLPGDRLRLASDVLRAARRGSLHDHRAPMPTAVISRTSPSRAHRGSPHGGGRR